MPEAAQVVKIVKHIGPYDLKSMKLFTYKNRFSFYFQEKQHHRRSSQESNSSNTNPRHRIPYAC